MISLRSRAGSLRINSEYKILRLELNCYSNWILNMINFADDIDPYKYHVCFGLFN